MSDRYVFPPEGLPENEEIGGPPTCSCRKENAYMPAGHHFVGCPSIQDSQDASGDERDRALAQIALECPPLLGANWERLEACQRAVALVLLDAGVNLRLSGRLAALVVARLQEPLES